MDFDACRFDFRLDAKSGVMQSMPAKRRRTAGERREGECYSLFRCKVCGSLFDSRSALLDHKLFHSNTYSCNICSETFHRKSVLKTHVAMCHASLLPVNEPASSVDTATSQQPSLQGSPVATGRDSGTTGHHTNATESPGSAAKLVLKSMANVGSFGGAMFNYSIKRSPQNQLKGSSRVDADERAAVLQEDRDYKLSSRIESDDKTVISDSIGLHDAEFVTKAKQPKDDDACILNSHLHSGDNDKQLQQQPGDVWPLHIPPCVTLSPAGGVGGGELGDAVHQAGVLVYLNWPPYYAQPLTTNLLEPGDSEPLPSARLTPPISVTSSSLKVEVVEPSPASEEQEKLTEKSEFCSAIGLSSVNKCEKEPANQLPTATARRKFAKKRLAEAVNHLWETKLNNAVSFDQNHRQSSATPPSRGLLTQNRESDNLSPTACAFPDDANSPLDLSTKPASVHHLNIDVGLIKCEATSITNPAYLQTDINSLPDVVTGKRSVKDKIGSHVKKAQYRCPVEGCFKALRTLSGLKNHQACHTVTHALVDTGQASEETAGKNRSARDTVCRPRSRDVATALLDSKTSSSLLKDSHPANHRFADLMMAASTALALDSNCSKRRNSSTVTRPAPSKLPGIGGMTAKHPVYKEASLQQSTPAARPKSIETASEHSQLEERISAECQASSPPTRVGWLSGDSGSGKVLVGGGGGGSFVCIFCGMILGSQAEVAEHVQQQHYNPARHQQVDLDPYTCAPSPYGQMMLYGAAASAVSASVPALAAGRNAIIEIETHVSGGGGGLCPSTTNNDVEAMAWVGSAGGGGGGDKYLTCDFPGCCKNFRELKHLKVHKMQHTDERPLKCLQCDYSCRQRNSMNWHMKSKHGKEKMVDADGRTVYV